MLFPRIYKPKKDELIYHYCSADTFHAICTNKSIRFCDLFTMNDFLEMHWGYSIWEKVANDIFDEVGKEFLDKMDEVIHASGIQGLLLASCFSLSGDVLSQWRAYADDGKGYVIGFNARELLKLPIRALKIQYVRTKQIAELKRVVRAMYMVEQQEKEKFNAEFVQQCLLLSFDLASFKNPAFAEEKEVRLVHLLNFEESNEFLKLVDNGGTAFGQETPGQEVKFIMYDNAPKAYLDFDFSNEGKCSPIKEVIIGPKNSVQSTAISVYLETLGIGNVAINRSRASYR